MNYKTIAKFTPEQSLYYSIAISKACITHTHTHTLCHSNAHARIPCQLSPHLHQHPAATVLHPCGHSNMLLEVVCHYPAIQKTRQHKTKKTMLCIFVGITLVLVTYFLHKWSKNPNSKMLWCVGISSQVPATSFHEMFLDSFLSLQLKLLFCLSTYTTTFYGFTQSFMAHTNIKWTDPLGHELIK